LLEFRAVSLGSEPARSLVRAMRAEIKALYEGVDLDSPDMPKASPNELGPPAGTFLVGYDEHEEPVCCGGVKDVGDGICEIKRMYVVPEARRSGRAGELLAALEDAARELGYETARLDTGPRQPHAERFYRRAGYQPIHNFNGNPVASFFGEKRL
jgi:GNAT superfamily N-acetyltransferase